jgi:hypothetical protein
MNKTLRRTKREHISVTLSHTDERPLGLFQILSGHPIGYTSKSTYGRLF